MTSSNGNIFRVTGHLCGEFTGPGEVPAQRPVTRSFHVFFDLRPNKWLSKQSWGWWFETLSCPLWRHRNEAWLCSLVLVHSRTDTRLCVCITCYTVRYISHLICLKIYILWLLLKFGPLKRSGMADVFRCYKVWRLEESPCSRLCCCYITCVIFYVQCIPRNMHMVLLCFALLWLCNRS